MTALPRSEERIDSVLAAAQMDFWEWDIAANRVTWSKGVYATFGLPPGSFGGTYEAFLALVHPDDRAGFLKALEETLADQEEGHRFDLDLRIVRGDGQIRWLHFQSQVFRDQTGKPLRIMGLGMDITERKQAEEKLRRSQARFAKVFQDSPAIMLVTSLDEGRILEVNAAFTKALGYAREEVVGRTEQEVRMWAKPTQRQEILARLAAEGTLQDLEATLICKSGFLLAGLCSFVVLELEQQLCLLGIVVDITERKWAEKRYAQA